jgi:hypothetical protein
VILSILTLIMKALSLSTVSIMTQHKTLSITIHSIMTQSVTTLSIKTLDMVNVVLLSVIMLNDVALFYELETVVIKTL